VPLTTPVLETAKRNRIDEAMRMNRHKAALIVRSKVCPVVPQHHLMLSRQLG